MQSIKSAFLTIYYKFFDNKKNTYASFSKRFGSFVIDSIVILIIFKKHVNYLQNSKKVL